MPFIEPPPSSVIYGDQEFLVETIERWEERAVYDQDNSVRLMIHYVIGVKAIWNPAATRVAPGVSGAVSLRELREEVLEPRQTLKVIIGGQTILQSPLIAGGRRYTTDARNGPHPLALNVMKIIGVKTLVVYFEIETWLPVVCPENDISVLSHRWDSRVDYDELFQGTCTITGQAVFRTDRLISFNRLPDDFRQRLFHPVRSHYQRYSVEVMANSAGDSVRYTIVDKEVPANLVGSYGSPIAKIRGEWRMGFVNKTAFFDLFPSPSVFHYVGVRFRIWGRRDTRRADYVNILVRAAAAYGFTDLQNSPKYYKGDLTIDLWDRFAELDTGLVLDGSFGNWVEAVGGLFGAGRKPFDKVRDLFKKRLFPDEIDGITTLANVPNPRPPAGGGSRGPLLERLVTQALWAQCTSPAPPPAPPVTTAQREVTF